MAMETCEMFSAQKRPKNFISNSSIVTSLRYTADKAANDRARMLHVTEMSGLLFL